VLDEDVRTSCFAQLSILCAEFGEDMPYRGGLDRGFAFCGQRVPYLSPQKGIFRAAVQRGPAALSIQTSANSPYRDVETPDGFLYDYRAGSIDQPTTELFAKRMSSAFRSSTSSARDRAGTGRTSRSS
jgi:hypothetical protein